MSVFLLQKIALNWGGHDGSLAGFALLFWWGAKKHPRSLVFRCKPTALPPNHPGVYHLRPTETPMGKTIIASWIPNSREEGNFFYLARCSLGRWAQPRACFAQQCTHTMHKYRTESLGNLFTGEKASRVTGDAVHLTSTSKKPLSQGEERWVHAANSHRSFSWIRWILERLETLIQKEKLTQIAGDSKTAEREEF